MREEWGDSVRVEHEPIQHAARLRQLFRCFDAGRQEDALRDPVIGTLVRDLVREAENRPVLIFGNTLSHLAPVFHRLLGTRLRLLHLHRDPVITAASIFVKTRPEWWSRGVAFEQDSHGLRITPFDPPARFPEYRERWAELTLFEVILYQWFERHSFALEAAERFPELPFLSLRSEDLFDEPAAAIDDLARFVNLNHPGTGALRRARRNQSWSRSLEQHPLGEEWRSYASHPAVVALARELGHPMEAGWLERETKRYRMPPGVRPWLRRRTGYWERRARVAQWLRRRGLVPHRTDEHAGLPPRSLAGALRELVLRR